VLSSEVCGSNSSVYHLTHQSGNCVDSVPDHFEDALDYCRENLNPDQLNKVCNLLKEFSNVFATLPQRMT
jgi:hypothetical protein